MITSSDLKNSYNRWALQAFDYSDVEQNLIRIDTPFFDRHNDSLILYALPKSNNSILLTDGGYILDDLETSGVYINNSKPRKNLLNTQLRSYGVSLNSQTNEMYIESTISDFPNDKHRLLQAMLFTNDMFMLAHSTNSNIFFDDVANFMDENNIRALRNISITGLSGMSHKFEFSIPGIKEIPDKLIKTLNVPNNEMYAKALTADVRNASEVVDRATNFYTIINDTDKEIKADVSALLEYEGIIVIPFSERESFVEQLAI